MRGEIRKVAQGWEHPRREDGTYKPMFEEPYVAVLQNWINNHLLWEKGEHPDQKNSMGANECRFFAEWYGDPPSVEYYNPHK